MTDNLNDNLYEHANTQNMLPFCEEITIMKTEIKEESYDFELSMDEMECVNVKQECTSSPEIYFEGDGLDRVKSTEQSLNGNIDIRSCEIREADVGNNSYRCQLCHCDFEENIHLSAHYEQCLLLAEQKTSERNGNLTKDILVKQSAKPKKYKCADCNYSTIAKPNMKEHIRIHTNERPFKCTYKNCKCTPENEGSCECSMCDYAATQNGNLIKHILHRHSTEPKKYKCKDCNYDTYSKAFLVTHSRIHIGERPYKCTYKNCKCTPETKESCECGTCRYATTTRRRIQRHIVNMHRIDPQRHKCSHCNYSTKTKARLVLHVRTHTGEKPFKCTYKNCTCTPEQEASCECSACEFAYSYNYRLKQHILAKHTAESKQFKCRDCNYATHKKTSLMLHNCMHSGKKPFKCTYKNCKCIPGQEKPCGCSMCEYAATRNCDLKRHILRKHSVEVQVL